MGLGSESDVCRIDFIQETSVIPISYIYGYWSETAATTHAQFT